MLQMIFNLNIEPETRISLLLSRQNIFVVPHSVKVHVNFESVLPL